MADNAAALLDELMGKNRNVLPNEKFVEKSWEDPDVCKDYLCGFCPNQLFTNTRSDLGACDKIHDDHLKKDFQESSEVRTSHYHDMFLNHLQRIMGDVEKRIRRGQARLMTNQEKNFRLPSHVKEEEKIKMLTGRINELLAKVEELGCQGNVEEAQGVMRLCDQLKEEREQLQNATEQAVELLFSQEKQMEVCQICGAFLIVNDSQSRVDDHLMGKQHMGYARIKATLEEIQSKKQKDEEDRINLIKKEREERETAREKERAERQKRREEREKERDRDRERDRRSRGSDSRSSRRSRSRSRDHSRRSRRSRSRERRRSRERDRDRSRDGDRSREGDRSRDGDRSSHRRSRRSRSRDRRRSRSRDRHRSRSRRSRSRSHRSSRHQSEERKKDKESSKREGSQEKKEGDPAANGPEGREEGEIDSTAKEETKTSEDTSNEGEATGDTNGKATNQEAEKPQSEETTAEETPPEKDVAKPEETSAAVEEGARPEERMEQEDGEMKE